MGGKITQMLTRWYCWNNHFVLGNTHTQVGCLPLVSPGELFEYMDFCELVHTRGSMDGYFHMADQVALRLETKLPSMMLAGDPIDHVTPDQMFELHVESFPLIADS